MRWPFRLRRGPSSWTVRLHLFGPTLDLPTGSIVGGYSTWIVEAKGVSDARRAAIARAEADLAKIAGHPIVDQLFWSVEGVLEEAPKEDEKIGEFSFYENVDQDVPDALFRLGAALAGNDLWLYLDQDGLSIQPENDTQFGVSFCLEDEAYVVATKEWHAHYGDLEQAVACFRWLLTPFYRAVEESQKGERSASWIERWDANGWQPLDEVIYRNPTDPSKWLGGGWKREYRQQALLRPPEPYDEIVEGARLDAEGMPLSSVIGLKTETFPRPYAEERGWLHADYDFDDS